MQQRRELGVPPLARGQTELERRVGPSPRVGLLLSNVTSLIGTRAVAFRFKASGTAFQVDDVYLDPWKSD